VKTTHLKNLFLANAPLFTISLLLGYSFWYIASYNQIVTVQLDIPLCFASLPEMYRVQAPEKITVTLTAKRSDLYALDANSLAAHINVGKILPGKHAIMLTDQHLFLPKNITLTSYKPSNLHITIIQNTTV
jgi:hypothetical protein